MSKLYPYILLVNFNVVSEYEGGSKLTWTSFFPPEDEHTRRIKLLWAVCGKIASIAWQVTMRSASAHYELVQIGVILRP
jgi:hypothetical protein